MWRSLFERHRHLDTDAMLDTNIELLVEAVKASPTRVPKETGDEASHRLPRLHRDRRRRRIVADDLPGQPRDGLSGLHGSRSRSGRLGAKRPGRDPIVAGGRQRREGRADLHPGKRPSRRPRSQPPRRGCPRRKPGSPTSGSRCNGLARSRCSRLRSSRRAPCWCNPTSTSSAPRSCSKEWVSKAQLDEVQRLARPDEAAVAEAERRIGAAKLPNRSDMIDAATASVEAARHSLGEGGEEAAKRNVSSLQRERWRKSISGLAKW